MWQNLFFPNLRDLGLSDPNNKKATDSRIRESDAISSDYLLSSAFQSLLETLRPSHLKPGDFVLEQHEASDAAYFLQMGSVAVFTQTAYGPVPLATLNSPRLIGEIGVLTDLPRTASIKAISQCVIYRIDRALLREIGQQTPALLLSIITQLGQQIGAVNKAIGVYTNALSALEKREFDERILGDLQNPPPQLMEFAATFLRFSNQIRDKRRQQDELASGAIIQESLLPTAEISEQLRAKIDICAAMRPARDVGGDFFDYFMLDSRRIALSVGDVCGKGLPASLFMAVVVTVLRITAREKGSVAEIMARANRTLCRGNARSMFATVFFCVFDIETGELEYCNCGHSAPLLLLADNDSVTLPTTGIPLGLFEDRVPNSVKITIKPGDSLILYSDGVTEALNDQGVEFGESRLLAEARSNVRFGAAGTVEAIFSAVDTYSNGTEQSDDITCMVVSPLRNQ